MTLLEQIKRQASQLPPEKQSEVLDFVAFLRSRIEKSSRPARRSLKKHPAFGLWRNRDIDAVSYQQKMRAEWDNQA
jgi:hypothetical protein